MSAPVTNYEHGLTILERLPVWVVQGKFVEQTSNISCFLCKTNLLAEIRFAECRRGMIEFLCLAFVYHESSSREEYKQRS